jgi:hypothetical protein
MPGRLSAVQDCSQTLVGEKATCTQWLPRTAELWPQNKAKRAHDEGKTGAHQKPQRDPGWCVDLRSGAAFWATLKFTNKLLRLVAKLYLLDTDILAKMASNFEDISEQVFLREVGPSSRKAVSKS